MKTVARYHVLLVALHWAVAVLIVASLCVGFFELDAMANSDPHKLDLLQVHMAVGMGILALMLVRLAVRLCTSRPPVAGSRFTPMIEYGFYLLVIAMATTGLATAIAAGLNDIVFARSGDPLPPSLLVYPTRVAHGYLALLLVAFIALHLFAALPRLGRMLFGPRYSVEQR